MSEWRGAAARPQPVARSHESQRSIHDRLEIAPGIQARAARASSGARGRDRRRAVTASRRAGSRARRRRRRAGRRDGSRARRPRRARRSCAAPRRHRGRLALRPAPARRAVARPVAERPLARCPPVDPGASTHARLHRHCHRHHGAHDRADDGDGEHRQLAAVAAGAGRVQSRPARHRLLRSVARQRRRLAHSGLADEHCGSPRRVDDARGAGRDPGVL